MVLYIILLTFAFSRSLIYILCSYAAVGIHINVVFASSRAAFVCNESLFIEELACGIYRCLSKLSTLKEFTNT